MRRYAERDLELSLHYPDESTDVIALISCASQKSADPAPARELYVSALFRRSVRYVESLGVPWLILSAKHGVIHPSKPLQPYDLAITQLSEKERAAWRHRVAMTVEGLGCWKKGTRGILLLAGEEYARAFRGMSSKHVVRQPLEGMPVGRRLQWLKTNTPEAA